MNDITIEKPDILDFVTLADVWEASVRATHHFLTENDIISLRDAIMTKYLPDAKNLFCIRNENNHVIAFIGIEDGNIDMLFIHPDERGKGLGRILINFAIDNFNIETVDVNEQNEQAVGFYKKMGFIVISRDDLDSTGKPYPILHMKLAF